VHFLVDLDLEDLDLEDLVTVLDLGLVVLDLDFMHFLTHAEGAIVFFICML